MTEYRTGFWGRNKRKVSTLAATALISLSMSSAVFAEACGEPPVVMPKVPEGKKAEIGEIREARKAVIAYSERVDGFIACMDKRFARLSPYMTKDARARWAEDLAKIANDRTALQISINEAIRAYRRRRDTEKS